MNVQFPKLTRRRQSRQNSTEPLEARTLLTTLPLQPNSPGTKLFHPALTSHEVLQTVSLASAAYANTYADLDKYFASNPFDYGLEGWSVITRELLEYGMESERLNNNLFYRSESYPTNIVNSIFPGTAEAIVFRNSGTGDIALAFRGTAPLTDSGDWPIQGQLSHYDAFSNLFDAFDTYIDSQGVSRVIVTGHSLGGAMTELYMEDHLDTASVQYEAVAVASPLATYDHDDDSRILNVGHESDIVYSIIGSRRGTSNAVSDMHAVFDGFYLGDQVLDPLFAGNQHSHSVSYRHTTETLLQSQFYSETDRDSRVILSLTEEPDELERVAEDFFVDARSLVLGRNRPVTTESGAELSEHDYLVGGANDDWLEGFAGDDALRGDAVLLVSGGNDTLAGGLGDDTFLGTPGELDGDEIVDLSIGDRIGLIGETVVQEDITLGANKVIIDSDDGFLDFFGREIQIKLTRPLPPGATLRVLEETLEEGGSIIEVVGGGQDVAFVIDTTGSMADDIAAVKSQATAIIEEIFSPERGLTDSRIAVVGFNDPSTNVILPFTDQTDPEERKQAALAAINSISVSGGGDTPELTYTGLLQALDGRSGEWREDAVARRIIAFGDAPAKDEELRPDVERLAADINADIVSNNRSASSGNQRLPAPVQIFTVAIEDNAGATEDFQEIADFSGGTAFLAADATEIVDALLEVIDLPLYAVRSDEVSILERDSGSTDVTFTVFRDSGDGEAEVSLALTGTADADDVLSVPTSLRFDDGEIAKSVTLRVLGDTALEPTEELSLSIQSVDVPATFTGRAASVSIITDDGVGCSSSGAGNVRVKHSKSRLLLKGDSLSNSILITEIDDGLLLSGVGGTLINGRSEQLITRTVSSLRVDLRQGNDVVCMHDVVLSGDLQIRAKAGNNSVGLRDLAVGNDLRVLNGKGHDIVAVQGIAVSGSTSIKLGGGRDALLAENLEAANTQIQSGGHRDFVALRQVSTPGEILASTGRGDDKILIEETEANIADLRGGNGDDAVTLRANSFTQTTRKGIEQETDFPFGEELAGTLDALIARGLEIGGLFF